MGESKVKGAESDLFVALLGCITVEGATCCDKPEYAQRRLNAINDIARTALAKATSQGVML
ncbi:MAG: hypothetical protein ACD_74C00133G0002 [uncultured bacterium]|jgi:hypothetical protein|nr:MAG: hypothetical protein ACD_74C00133G0002 [uncultured bacterium]